MARNGNGKGRCRSVDALKADAGAIIALIKQYADDGVRARLECNAVVESEAEYRSAYENQSAALLRLVEVLDSSGTLDIARLRGLAVGARDTANRLADRSNRLAELRGAEREQAQRAALVDAVQEAMSTPDPAIQREDRDERRRLEAEEE